MKRKWCMIILGLLAFMKTYSQYYYYNDYYYDKDVIIEIGPSLGLMNCFTDLGGKSNAIKNFHGSGGFYTAFMYKDIAGIRLEATWGKVSAADSLGTTFMKRRNFSFRSDISEVALIGEFHPLMLYYNPDGAPKLSPYLMAGIGWFSFNPQTKLGDEWIYLQPLHTEGQGFKEYRGRSPYKLSQVAFPVGGGLKYELSNLFTIRGELIYRYLSTDYLDDVSTVYVDPALFDKYLPAEQATLAKALYWRGKELDPQATPPKIGGKRGNSKTNDTYFTLNIKIGFTLGRTRYR